MMVPVACAAIAAPVAATAVQETPASDRVVFLESGTEISFRGSDDAERWRCRIAAGEFYRSDGLGRSKVVTDGRTLWVDSTEALHAIDVETGALRWSFEFPRPAPLVHLARIVLHEDRLLLTTNQVGNPLVCLDTHKGSTSWTYPEPGPEQIGFYELAVRDGAVLVRVAATHRDRPGYVYENRAIDLRTGTRLPWPAHLSGVPGDAPDAGTRIAVSFAGEADAPTRRGDRFIGILERRESGVYALRRPRFFADGPLYVFQDDGSPDFPRLAGRRVEVRGDVITIAESQPPRYLIRPRAIIERRVP